MKIIGGVAVVAVVLSGCTTAGSLNKAYARLDRSDGISRSEAVTIARKALLDSKSDAYHFNNPRVYDDESLQKVKGREDGSLDRGLWDGSGNLKYPHSWYIVFSSRLSALFSNYYLVVVDQATGDIRYVHDYSAFAEAMTEVVSNQMKEASPVFFVMEHYYQDHGRWPVSGEELGAYAKNLKADDFDPNTFSTKGLVIEKVKGDAATVKFEDPDQNNAGSFIYELTAHDGKINIAMKPNGGPMDSIDGILYFLQTKLDSVQQTDGGK